MKNDIDEKEAIELLRQAGWTASEIERLRRVRRDYVAQKGGQAAVSSRRSVFIRWLATLLQQGDTSVTPWWW